MLEILDTQKSENRVINFEKSSQAWLENSPVCTKVVDPNFNLLYMSKTGIRDLKIKDIKKYYGKPFPLEFYPEAFKNTMYEALKKVKQSGEPMIHEDVIVNSEGIELCYESTISPVYTEEGILDYFMVVSLEISKRKQVEVKNVMLKEIHHRIKNNLQIVSSLLSLQSSKCDDYNLKRIIDNSKQRISTISLVHEKIYQSDGSSDVFVKSYIEDLISNISSTYSSDINPIRKEISIVDFKMNMETLIPCSLILNEIITNSYKYGFQDNLDPFLCIKISKNENEISMFISDNGPGMTELYEKGHSTSLGMDLIETLSSQIKAEVNVISKKDSGVSYNLTFSI